MMCKIKYALAFLWGAVFSSGIWYLVLFDAPPLRGKLTADGLLWTLIFALVVFSLAAMCFAAIAFFVDYWND